MPPDRSTLRDHWSFTKHTSRAREEVIINPTSRAKIAVAECDKARPAQWHVAGTRARWVNCAEAMAISRPAVSGDSVPRIGLSPRALAALGTTRLQRARRRYL